VNRLSLNIVINTYTVSKTKLFLCLVLVSLLSVRGVRQGRANPGRQIVAAITIQYGGTSRVWFLSLHLASCHPSGALNF
jgi:hypothetical protein